MAHASDEDTNNGWGKPEDSERHRGEDEGKAGQPGHGARDGEAEVPKQPTITVQKCRGRIRRNDSGVSQDMAAFAKKAIANPQYKKNHRYASTRGAKSRSRCDKLMYRFIVDPETSKALVRWDLCGATLMFVVAMWTPYELAFLACAQRFDARDILNHAINLFFLSDMMLQFVLAVPVQTPYGTRLVNNFTNIAKKYLGSWFCIDLLSILPFNLMAPCEGLASLRLVRLLRLLKMLRLLRGLRMFFRWQNELGFSNRKTTLYMIFGTMLIASHWSSCLLGLMSRQQGTDCIPAIDPECTETWLTNAVTKTLGDGYVPFAAEAYLVSLHASMSLLVHPHTYQPTSPGETAVFIVLMLIGGFLWTQVISRSTALCTSLNRHNIIHQQTMDDVTSISSDLGLSRPMQRRLRKYFNSNRTYTKHEEWKGIVRRMSPQLQRESLCELNREWILKIPFLNDFIHHVTPAVSKSFTADIAIVMEIVTYAEEEHIGELFKMYVMRAGLVCRKIKFGRKQQLKMLGPGAVWAEDHLLLSNPDLLDDTTALALMYVEVLTLAKADFDTIVARYPELQHRIRRATVRYAVLRGIPVYLSLTHGLQCASEDNDESDMVLHLRRRRQQAAILSRGCSGNLTVSAGQANEQGQVTSDHDVPNERSGDDVAKSALVEEDPIMVHLRKLSLKQEEIAHEQQCLCGRVDKSNAVCNANKDELLKEVRKIAAQQEEIMAAQSRLSQIVLHILSASNTKACNLNVMPLGAPLESNLHL